MLLFVVLWYLQEYLYPYERYTTCPVVSTVRMFVLKCN